MSRSRPGKCARAKCAACTNSVQAGRRARERQDKGLAVVDVAIALEENDWRLCCGDWDGCDGCCDEYWDDTDFVLGSARRRLKVQFCEVMRIT